MNFKEIARSLTPPVVWKGLRLSKYHWNLKHFHPFKRYYGYHYLDREIEKFVNFDNGVFIELGAANGLLNSNSYYFEKHRGWRGILIEATPMFYLECIRNRPKAEVFFGACVPFDFPEKFVEITCSRAMSTVTGVDLLPSQIDDVGNHIRRSTEWLSEDEVPFKMGSPAVTLTDLVERSSFEHIDLLSLDVEGQELNVLNGLDFARYAPRYICVEARRPKQMEIFLSGRGYKLLSQLSHHDYLYTRKEMKI